MSRIYSRSGRKGAVWYMDYALDGRRVRKRLGRSKRLAELALAEVQVKLERRELGFAAQDRKLSDFIEEYLNYSKGNKAQKSYERDILTLKHLTAFIQADKLSAVTASKLEAYKTHRREKGAKPATLNRELNTIKAMFNKALAWNALAQNPAKSVQKFREPRRQVRYLTKEEVRALLEAADDRLCAVIVTFLHTGMRRDELIHLTWADLDLKSKVLSVPAKEGWHPKDYEVRHIPMTPRLAETLHSLPKGDGSYVFTNGQSKPLNAIGLSKAFRRLIRSCGIKGASLHTLRHYSACRIIPRSSSALTAIRRDPHRHPLADAA